MISVGSIAEVRSRRGERPFARTPSQKLNSLCTKVQGENIMSEERLDRIERLVETAFLDVFQSLKLLNERQINSQTQMEALRDNTQRQINHAQNQIDALFESQRLLTENQRSMMESMETLANFQVETTERLAAVTEHLDSVGAAVERLEQICNYLLKQEGNSN